MATTITLKQKEGKTLKFEYKQSNGSVFNLSLATINLFVKDLKSDATYVIQKSDGDFDKSQASSGIVKVILNTTDLDVQAKKYVGEIVANFSVSSFDRSDDFFLDILEKVETTP